MKNILAFALAVLICASFVACNEINGNVSINSEDTSDTSASVKDISSQESDNLSAADNESEVSEESKGLSLRAEGEDVIFTVDISNTTVKRGEKFVITATVFNKTDEDMSLYIPVLGLDTHQEIFTNITQSVGEGADYRVYGIFDEDVYDRSFDTAIDHRIIPAGETYVQVMTFDTNLSNYSDSPLPFGVYDGECGIIIEYEGENGENDKKYNLDFEITLTE